MEVETIDHRPVIKRMAQRPSLNRGRLGTFDDSGAVPTSLVEDGERKLLYYTGWTLGGTVPFLWGIGVAESFDGGETFNRLSEAPILGRNRHDPFLTSAAWVIKESGGFRMWYVSGTEWVRHATEGSPVHYYTIKHAKSLDGIEWETNDQICLPYQGAEHALARPIVKAITGGYRMIYSARRLGETYRIYSASSVDGLTWQRNPQPVLELASSGWDSEMVCYGSLLEDSEDTFLLYNGNAYGRDGFGAVAIEPDLEIAS